MRRRAEDRAIVSERVLAIFDEAMDERPGANTQPSLAIESAVSSGTSAVIDRLVDRWACDSDTCPGRPGWDAALSEAWDRITDNAEQTMREAFRAIVIRELEGFAKAHPEAAWREAAAT